MEEWGQVAQPRPGARPPVPGDLQTGCHADLSDHKSERDLHEAFQVTSFSYPRVLHVGFTEMGVGNSAAWTLGRAFSDWPSDRLLQVCFRPENPTDHVLRLTDPTVRPRRRVGGMQVVGRTSTGCAQGLDPQAASIRQRMDYFISTVGDLRPIHIPKDVVRQIDRFRPEVIHCPVWGVRPIKLCLSLSEKFSIHSRRRRLARRKSPKRHAPEPCSPLGSIPVGPHDR
jgi:hypothetical protein